MMKKLGISLIALVLILTSCKEDKVTTKPSVVNEKATVNFSFRLKAGNDFISGNDTAYLANGYEAYFSIFKLYFSNIAALDSNNTETLIKDVVLLDPVDINKNSFSAQIPKGTYSGFKIGLGLDSLQNAADPGSFVDSHPLATYQSMYWSMLKYRFAKIEGKANTMGNLGTSTDILMAYHTGRDEIYRVLNLDDNSIGNEFYLDKDYMLHVDVVIDLDIFFDGAGGTVDIANEGQTHSEPNEMPLTHKITDNLESAISYSFSIVAI